MTSAAEPTPMPSVTVLVPARNEAHDIRRCIEAIAAQDHPLDQIEVVVVDGGSTDDTAAVAGPVLEQAGFARWEIVSNPVGTTPSNLNAGLAASTAPLLCRVDARSLIPADYVRRCVAVLAERPSVAVVGGAQVARSRDRSPLAVGIARALNNSWGMGFARYRRGAPSGPADTVYLGAFRTDDLRAVGGWDERMTTNQDFDLNRRLAARGLVWYEADLPVGYLPRADVVAVLRQYHRFGRWKVRYWRWTGERPRPRQLAILAVPPVAGLALLASTRRRPGRLAAVAAAGITAAFAVEEAGRPRGPEAGSGLPTRVVSVLTLASVWVGWLSGVARQAVTRDADRPG